MRTELDYCGKFGPKKISHFEHLYLLSPSYVTGSAIFKMAEDIRTYHPAICKMAVAFCLCSTPYFRHFQNGRGYPNIPPRHLQNGGCLLLVQHTLFPPFSKWQRISEHITPPFAEWRLPFACAAHASKWHAEWRLPFACAATPYFRHFQNGRGYPNISPRHLQNGGCLLLVQHTLFPPFSKWQRIPEHITPPFAEWRLPFACATLAASPHNIAILKMAEANTALLWNGVENCTPADCNFPCRSIMGRGVCKRDESGLLFYRTVLNCITGVT